MGAEAEAEAEAAAAAAAAAERDLADVYAVSNARPRRIPSWAVEADLFPHTTAYGGTCTQQHTKVTWL